MTPSPAEIMQSIDDNQEALRNELQRLTAQERALRRQCEQEQAAWQERLHKLQEEIRRLEKIVTPIEKKGARIGYTSK